MQPLVYLYIDPLFIIFLFSHLRFTVLDDAPKVFSRLGEQTGRTTGVVLTSDGASNFQQPDNVSRTSRLE